MTPTLSASAPRRRARRSLLLRRSGAAALVAPFACPLEWPLGWPFEWPLEWPFELPFVAAPLGLTNAVPFSSRPSLGVHIRLPLHDPPGREPMQWARSTDVAGGAQRSPVRPMRRGRELPLEMAVWPR